ncbi:MAG: uroporphyrinogen-III synthase [Nitrospirota bacterium]
MNENITIRSLAGKQIIVTRSHKQATEFIDKLVERGASVISLPAIEVIPPSNWDKLDHALNELNHYHWIIFTSVNAVTFFMKRLCKENESIRLPSGVQVCAVGPKTAERLQLYGVQPDLIPTEYNAEGLLAAFGALNISGTKMLIPRAKVAREFLPEELQKRGAQVTVVPVYETIMPEQDVSRIKALLIEKKITAVTFTSGSTVRNFIEMIGQKEYTTLLSGVVIACMGPITAKIAQDYGLKTDIMPADSTIPAFANAIADFFTAGMKPFIH